MFALILFVGTLALSGLASLMVRWKFNKYSKVRLGSGMSGHDIAQRILSSRGLDHVTIHRTEGALTDHYDPSTRSVHLSPDVHDGVSLAAAGVAAHEVGHALQHQASYAPLHARAALVKSQGVASMITMVLPFLGGMTSFIPGGMKTALLLTAIAWGVILLFNLVTLPVEFDASSRAKRVLVELGLVTREEVSGIASVLWAAAFTYVAAFITSLLYALLHILPLLMGSRREED
jgi:uncharacterized protein